MPKIRTNRAAAKRFRFTGTGQVRRNKANKRHLLTKKTRERKRRLRQGALVAPTDLKAIKRMMPYGG